MVDLSSLLYIVSIVYSSCLYFVSSIFPSLFLTIPVLLMIISMSQMLLFLLFSAILGCLFCFAMILSIVLLLLLRIVGKIFSFTGSFQIQILQLVEANKHIQIFIVQLSYNKTSIIKIDYCSNEKMHDNDSFLTTISEKEKHTDIIQPKFISASKWQKYMIENLKLMMTKYHQKKNLISDLLTIVSSVPEESFVQATLKMRPFKPQFLQTAPIFATVTQSTVAETVAKHVKFSPCKFKQKQQLKRKQRITEKTLTHQFEKDYHPFKFITKNFKRLMELKFKSLIDSKKLPDLNSISTEIKSDMAIFCEFFHKAAQPYKKLFKCPSQQGQQDQNNKYEQFLDYFLSQNEKLNRCIHKIFSYACKALYKQKIDLKIQDYVNPQDFTLLPAQFRIDGGYVRTLNSMMEFAQMFSQEKGIKKLVQIRQNILVDINQFYHEKKLEKELQVSAEVQIQIIRFCIAKLKGWATDILASLKFLEYAFGEDEMGYKYEESSYLYTQLSMAFEVLQLDS